MSTPPPPATPNVRARRCYPRSAPHGKRSAVEVTELTLVTATDHRPGRSLRPAARSVRRGHRGPAPRKGAEAPDGARLTRTNPGPRGRPCPDLRVIATRTRADHGG